MKIAVLAKGKTLAEYPGPAGYDEVWGLNQLAKTHKLDKLFVMDDLKLRMPHYDGPEFPEWLKSYPGRIITSRQYEEWPTSRPFPIEDVAKHFGLPLGIAMYSTVDYMLAYAIYKEAKQIDLFGVDCVSNKMELVRTSIAVWIGAAMSRGIRVTSRDGSFSRYWTYAGRCLEQGLYGYVDRPRIETLV
jgi:hypothetical protein